jgi:signal transduction histidine kinase
MDPQAESAERVDLLLEMAGQLFSGDDPQRLVELVTEARGLAQRLNYSKGEAYSLLYEGLSCCFLAKHQKGLQTTDLSKSMFEALGDEEGVALTKLINANILRSIGSFDQALPGLYEVLEFFRARGHPYWEATCLYDLGLLYHEIGDYEKAFENFSGCIELLKDLPERWLEARAINGLGTSLSKQGKYEEALEHHDRSRTIFKEIGHQMGESRVLDDIGSIHLNLGDHDMALAFHTKSLEIREAIGMRRAQGTSLLNIARVHLQEKGAEKALQVLDKALAVAEETESKPQIYAAHQLLSEAYELQNNHVNALKQYKQFQQGKEEVFNDQTSDRIQKLHIGFEVEKAEREAEFERLKNVELSDKNERLEQLLRELRETQSQLVQSEKMAVLGKLVAGIVHEMNTPVGASSSAMDVSERCIEKIAELQAGGELLEADNGQLQSLLQRVQDTHRITRDANARISKILASLKSFSRLDEGERQATDIHEGLESTLALLEHECGDRIEIIKEYGKLPAVNCRPGEMNQVFMNLLANAVESIEGEGEITIRTSARNGSVYIEVADTGAGIPRDRLERLFDPGFSHKGQRVKAGMGLLVSYNIVQKHGGKIEVASEVDKGTTFTVIVPVSPS